VHKKHLAIGMVAAIGVLVAFLMPSSLAVPMGEAVGSADATEETEDDDTAESSPPVVVGGGWYKAVVGDEVCKNTFGLLISGDKNYTDLSALVFHGRDADVKIISIEFTQISFFNEDSSVEAFGWCTANGETGYWFHVVAEDLGRRTLDTLGLFVYADANADGMMDEDTPAWSWETSGLGGGQIASGEEAEQMEPPEI